MSDTQIYLTLAVFGAVILAIAFDVIDMAVATLLGLSVLIATAVLNEQDIVAAMRTAGAPLALLFGGMVVARTLASTGIFDRVGALYLRATRGSGRRFLLLLVALVAPLCAFLPNATTVILLAPIIIKVADALEVDFVRPMVLTAIVSNSAGLLTLVGDPATFLVGSSIGMSFGRYLRTVSLGGVMSVMVVVAQLPAPILPPTVAIIAAALALLLIYGAKVESVDQVLHDIDWKTLVFLAGIFCLVQGMTKTGLFQQVAVKLYGWAGAELTVVGLALIFGIGLLSSLLANIPVVAASILMVEGYLVAAAVVPETAMAAHFVDWPARTIPVFVAMMFGATLGGNATLIGASANVVTAGICARNGRPLTFVTWLRYGLLVTACQLALAAVYVLALFHFMR